MVCHENGQKGWRSPASCNRLATMRSEHLMFCVASGGAALQTRGKPCARHAGYARPDSRLPDAWDYCIPRQLQDDQLKDA